MIDIVKKLAELVKGGGGAGGIGAAAGSAGGGMESLKQLPGIATPPIMSGGPAPDTGVLSGGGNSPTDILLRTLKGAQAGMQTGQQPQQGMAPSPMMVPPPPQAAAQINRPTLQPYMKRY